MPGGWTDNALRFATYALFAGFGILLGTIGAFLVPDGIVGGFLSLATLVAVAGNVFVGLLGLSATGSAGGAFAALAGWFVAVGAFATFSPGGDVVIPGGLANDPGVVHAGVTFMIAGLVGSVVTIVLTSRYTARVNPPKSLP
ncbi:MAG TPA: hypothetical protein VHV76_06685 [Mycobacteriales bacterium]|nr:hypothetical protein [Mycobacteriales bacterium]